jgi:hypothetical protein
VVGIVTIVRAVSGRKWSIPAVCIGLLLTFVACEPGVTTRSEGTEQSGTEQSEGSAEQDQSEKPPLSSAPGNKLLVVNANLRESHPKWPDDIRAQDRLLDLESPQELINFANHVREHVPYAPDILLLQEVIGPSARRTAKELESKLDRPYRAIVTGHDSNLIGPKGDDYKHKRNTAVIIDQSRIAVVGSSGFTTLEMKPGDEPPKEPRIAQEQAYALLRRRGSGLNIGVMSAHWSTTYHFGSPGAAAVRRLDWAQRATAFMESRFPEADISIMAGEFNAPRCLSPPETLDCRETKTWRTLTSKETGYRDSVYFAHRDSPEEYGRQVENRSGSARRIDFIFARAKIFDASRSTEYNTEMFTPGFISDHKYDFALLGAIEPSR